MEIEAFLLDLCLKCSFYVIQAEAYEKLHCAITLLICFELRTQLTDGQGIPKLVWLQISLFLTWYCPKILKNNLNASLFICREFEMCLLNTDQLESVYPQCNIGQQEAFYMHYLIIAVDSLGEYPGLMLLLWLCLQHSLQSVCWEATQSSRTPTSAPPSAPAGCNSQPCRTLFVTTPSLQAGTSFRSLTSQTVCQPSVWR